MRIVSRKRLLEFSEIHADAADSLDAWYRVAKSSGWANLVDVRQTYPAADAVGNFTVFNIKGNDYRLITSIVYATGRIYIKYVLTHAEYDKDKWKDDPYY
ncbi:type II toxin-antitoxin system HigB family toxin [Chamaesiphon polymorphus]|uniref:Type II toxin-antitoxin system HigB family toxin n=1 Tax=Chamaesiphon polymorphus CCALA 037 TaxID=2107692 RepID=A0A2T1GC85_9CYAN|nr:type II toxin-antitoxin system HigB family toxin [Chamaesiphon polymorphus]PSB54988.1 type II toxin-antitoxin system HigB family toxin [Chamaesiphon polymorphus CCALA 037]